MFWSAAATMGGMLAGLMIGPRHEHGPDFTIVRTTAAAFVCVSLAIAHGHVVRESLLPWIGTRAPVWKCVGAALVIDGLWIAAVLAAAPPNGGTWKWFCAVLAASLFVTYATLRLWFRMRSVHAALSAIPLVASVLMILIAGGLVFGRLSTSINP